MVSHSPEVPEAVPDALHAPVLPPHQRRLPGGLRTEFRLKSHVAARNALGFFVPSSFWGACTLHPPHAATQEG